MNSKWWASTNKLSTSSNKIIRILEALKSSTLHSEELTTQQWTESFPWHRSSRFNFIIFVLLHLNDSRTFRFNRKLLRSKRPSMKRSPIGSDEALEAQ